MHYWYGCIDTPHKDYRKHVSKFRIITDNLRIKGDKGNKIPDKSWMLYLLEIFNIQRVAVELNLICQFDNQDYFEAIFKGHNQYRFKKVLPQIGHSYHREINFIDKDSSLEFYLKDINLNEDEKFFLKVDRELVYFSVSSKFHWSLNGGTEFHSILIQSDMKLKYQI